MTQSSKIPLLEIINIKKSFGSQEILKNLNLTIYPSETLGLIGTSGSGKSTLFKILLGFYPPNYGTIKYHGSELRSFKEIRRVVGFVSQENSFYEKLTVKENLLFFAKLYHIPKHERNERMTKLLKLVNLTDATNKIAEKLSGGMKRRLEFAISLIHNPSILILDEPFTGLDIYMRKELWKVIEEIKKSNVTIIIASHMLQSIQHHCDRISILHNKHISHNFKNSPKLDLETFFMEATQ